MGANAQTSVPTFTAGDVLTAANMNISARTGVPVFADTTARDAAFGGAGEKTLAEGQLCYVENLSGIAQLQFYDGSSWISFTAGGLSYLTGASFTTATSFSLPNSTFTSTYRNYRLLMTLTAVTADADFTIRLRASGTDNSSANYQQMAAGSNTTPTAALAGAANATAFSAGESDVVCRYSLSMDIIAPQVVENTYIHGFYTFVDKPATLNFYRNFGQMFVATNQFDSLSFISSVASSITGSYRVYGYTES